LLEQQLSDNASLTPHPAQQSVRFNLAISYAPGVALQKWVWEWMFTDWITPLPMRFITAAWDFRG
jgi:hypothetical protein